MQAESLSYSPFRRFLHAKYQRLARPAAGFKTLCVIPSKMEHSINHTAKRLARGERHTLTKHDKAVTL